MNKFPNGSVFYRDLERPYSEVVRGEGIYLYDRRGKQYIDGSGGALVVNIGHGDALHYVSPTNRCWRIFLASPRPIATVAPSGRSRARSVE